MAVGRQNLEQYRILDWDTSFFGFKVARIVPNDLTTERLKLILGDLRKDGVRLAYWLSDRIVPTELGCNGKISGCRFVGERVTFTADLEATQDSGLQPRAAVRYYDPVMGYADIEGLAVQSGQYSRFANDPNVPKEKFIELYTTWVRRSVKKEIADEVLVIPHEGRITGMVTLATGDGNGVIGLVAVDRAFRGRGYGETLVRAAREWFVKSGCRHSQVVTQGQNIAACKLYAKCGYAASKVEYCYHFWL